jgi:hypothetical protein
VRAAGGVSAGAADGNSISFVEESALIGQVGYRRGPRGGPTNHLKRSTF